MQIRPVEIDDCDGLGLLTVSALFGTFLGHVPEEELDFDWTPAQSAAGWREFLAGGGLGDDEFFSVADNGDRVAGMVWAGARTGRDDYQRFVSGLYVLPTRQGHGLGRALLRHAAERLHAVGVESLLIGCVAVNPSCGFYRHLGGSEIYREPITVDRHQTEEIFFGWSSLEPLLELTT